MSIQYSDILGPRLADLFEYFGWDLEEYSEDLILANINRGIRICCHVPIDDDDETLSKYKYDAVRVLLEESGLIVASDVVSFKSDNDICNWLETRANIYINMYCTDIPGFVQWYPISTDYWTDGDRYTTKFEAILTAISLLKNN
jgi:hypothetical protein